LLHFPAQPHLVATQFTSSFIVYHCQAGWLFFIELLYLIYWVGRR